MSIRRSYLPAVDHFTTINNDWVRDSRLSLKARGLLVQLLSHRVGWEVSLESLVRENPEGRDAIRGAIRELESVGYLVREQSREGGRFGEMMYSLAAPVDVPEAPSSGFPTTVEPTSVDPTPKKNISQKNISKNSLRSASSESVEDLEMIQEEAVVDVTDPFDEFWTAYPKKADKGAARRAWAAVLKAGVDAQHVIHTAGLYAAQVKRDGIETRYVKNPSTWLRAESYDDVYLDPSEVSRKSPVDDQWNF